MQDRMDAGQVGCLIVIGQIQDRTDARQDGSRRGRLLERTDAGKNECRTGQK